MVLTAVREQREVYRLPGVRASEKPPAANDSLAPRIWTLSLTEADLSTLWAGQRFPAAALVTRAGAPVRVLHPGRAGRGAGPDFRDAIIAPPSGTVLRGDVELHVRASDFRAHGHERDRRYDGVVLHVVFEDDSDEETLLACGRRVAIVALAAWVRKRAHELSAWLSSPRLWREPCHDASARLGPEEVLSVLDQLGEQRFRERAAALAEQIQLVGPGEALFRAVLEGLGYGGNSALIAALFERVSWDEVAALLGPGKRATRAIEELIVTRAGDLLEGHAGRPANHPSLRIRGLAVLLTRHQQIFAEMPATGGILALSPRDLIGALTVAPLIGRSRAIELLTNAVLPWAVAEAATQRRADIEEVAFEHAARLPRPARYGALGFLETNLRSGDKPLALNAQRQQGLLALYKSECTQGGCGRCALS